MERNKLNKGPTFLRPIIENITLKIERPTTRELKRTL